MSKLIAPLVLLALALAAFWLQPEAWAMSSRLAEVVVWLAGAWVFVRVMDLLFWHGLIQRRQGNAPPRLLTDLFATGVFTATVLYLAVEVLSLPVASVITTSSVLVAVIGFALRDMIASLFAGIALNVEHPYGIGDWIEANPGQVGKVVEVSWLTTRLVTKEKVSVIVPNARLATGIFSNYGHAGQLFRTHVSITLDHGLSPGRVERILLAAARSVPEVASKGPGPDLKIESFDSDGVLWRVRFWLDDFDRLQEARYQVQRAVLQHLHQGGISLPYQKMDVFHAAMPERNLDYQAHRDRMLGRSELFRNLPREELKALAAACMERRFAAGALIVGQGDQSRSLFVVLEGVLEVFVDRGDGGRQVVNRLMPGAMFGEFALLTGEPRSASVQAAEPAVLLEIDEAAIGPVLQRCPGLAEDLSRILAQRQALTKSVDTSGKPAKREVAQHEDHLLARIRSLFGLIG